MSEAEKTAAIEPHPLQPLQDHLSGAKHDAGSAVKAIEAFIAKEIAKFRAEYSKGDKESE